jgi:hypothetical protein
MKGEFRLRKYLGFVSILILIATYLILQFFVGKQIGHLWVWIIGIGYLSSAIASWYSPRGLWRRLSATILIIIPVGYLIVFLLFIIGVASGSGF